MISRRLEEHPPYPNLPFVTVTYHFYYVKIPWLYQVALMNDQVLLTKDQEYKGIALTVFMKPIFF